MQNTKDVKRMDAEKAGYLHFWYNQLSNLVKDLPAYLIYNFDERGFQPGQGRSRKVIGTKGKCPSLAEFDHAENTLLSSVSLPMGGLWIRSLFLRAKSLWRAGTITLIYHTFGRPSLRKDISTIISLLDGFKNFMRQPNSGRKRDKKGC